MGRLESMWRSRLLACISSIINMNTIHNTEARVLRVYNCTIVLIDKDTPPAMSRE